MSKHYCFLTIIIIFLSFQTFFCQDYSDEIIFYSNGGTFEPLITVEGSPEITWTFDDNSTSSDTHPSKNYGTDALRMNRLKVTPWSALKGINIGYDAGDGGSYNIPFISNQKVSDVQHLALTAPYLTKWCSSYNNLTSLNFDNFVNLDTVECFDSRTVKSVSLKGCSKIKRLCLEDNDLDSLNLKDCTALEDLRGAQNAYPDITFPTTCPNLWHICIRDNPNITNKSMFADMSKFSAISELFIWYTQQTGKFAWHHTTKSDINIAAFGNQYDTLDLTGAFQDETGWAQIDFRGNQLKSINITNCKQLKNLNFAYNGMASGLTDNVLYQIDRLGTSGGTVNLQYNYPPSDTGFIFKANLERRGWTVYIQNDITFTDANSFLQNIVPNDSNQVLGRFKLTPTFSGATLTSTEINLNGSRTGFSNFKLWASNDSIFARDTQLGSIVETDPGDGNKVTFSGFTSLINLTGIYYFLTADISPTASGTIQGVLYIPGSLSIDNGSIANYFTNAPLSNGTTALPVELSSFTAKLVDGKVQLNWQTETETNNYGFEVERASTGSATSLIGSATDWEKIGFVPGYGISNSPKQYSFTDENPPAGKIQYRLKQIDTNGLFKFYSTIAEVANNTTDVNEVQLPTEFSLEQNYPNPFNPVTTIKFAIPSESPFSKGGSSLSRSIGSGSRVGFVTLTVYDILGNEVAVLVNEPKAPGYYEVKFDAGNLATGVYIYRLNAGNFTSVKKSMLMK